MMLKAAAVLAAHVSRALQCPLASAEMAEECTSLSSSLMAVSEAWLEASWKSGSPACSVFTSLCSARHQPHGSRSRPKPAPRRVHPAPLGVSGIAMAICLPCKHIIFSCSNATPCASIFIIFPGVHLMCSGP